MSMRIPSRRLGQSALAVLRPQSTRWIPTTSSPITAQRSISNPFKPKDKSQEDLSNPMLEKYLKTREIEEGATEQTSQTASRPELREGTMSTNPSSLFLPDREIPGWHPDLSPQEQEELKTQAQKRKSAAQAEIEKEFLSMNLDPSPHARKQLERKLVISSLKRHGRLSKAQTLARTERQSLYKSKILPTSVKKLQKVVNQIAGKTVSEALVQLRFSKKKVARDVIKGLEIAQNEAIAGRGMGLGSGIVAQRRWERQRNQTDSGAVKDITVSKAEKALDVEKSIKPTTIEMKDGSKKVVRDPTEIYIDQAWVGKGEMWKTPEFRARGAVNMLTHRTTSFSVLLKEEKTRMRLSDEIKKKRDKRKLWTALPDRPVTAQRQYCLW